jgi:hypothetical protein
MDKEQLKELLNGALGNLKGDTVSDENAAKFEEHLDAITDIVADIKEAFGDGLDLSDLHVVGQSVAPIMKLASAFGDYEGAQKKQFVQEVVWTIYNAIDKGDSGDENNINLPWLVGGVETRVEKWVIKFAAGMAVEALFKRLRDAEEV